MTTKIKSVCLFLGPYRNLTTLTAGVLALHPNCQVLNHGGERLLETHNLDFLANYSDSTFGAFCDWALDASQGGRRGNYGGSITLSHAFDRDVLRDAYQQRYGDTLVKSEITSLVWKESLFVTRMMKERQQEIQSLLDANRAIRFLMPVRNPMDCALSNIKTGHSKVLCPEHPESPNDVLGAVLAEIAWFRGLQRTYGEDRFFSFFEFEERSELMERLLAFLELPRDERWIADATRCFDLDARYRHKHAFEDSFRHSSSELFGDDPSFLNKLVQYAE